MAKEKAVPDPAAAAVGERRAWARHACALPTSCQPLMAGQDPWWGGQVENVSRGGLKFLSARRFEKDTLLQIEVEAVLEGGPLPLLARVVHVSRQPNGQWGMGCAFHTEISEEDLNGLLSAGRRPEG